MMMMMRELQKQCLPSSYGKSFNLCLLLVTFLSLRVESLFLQEGNMLFVDRPIEQNHILLDD